MTCPASYPSFHHSPGCLPCGYTRLVVQTRPEPESGIGRMSLALQNAQTNLGYIYISSMQDHLAVRGVNVAGALSHFELPTYHLIAAPVNNMFAVMAGLYHQFSNPTQPNYIEIIEPDIVLDVLASPPSVKFGTGFSLTAGKSSHTTYLADLNVAAASGHGVNGSGSRIAVIDTGLELGKTVTRYIDLTAAGSPPQADNHGHGTAMIEIVRSVATNADLYAIRITDKSVVFVWDLLAGVITAVYDVSAHVVSLSIGCKNLGSSCGICGGQLGARSLVCEKFFDLVSRVGKSGGPDPIIVASTGNDGQKVEFDWPARYDSVLAIGAITHAKDVSSFSNKATVKSQHVYGLCPGGEINPAGAITEYVGEGKDAGATTYCVGTSPATAYAAGVLGLLRHYHVLSRLGTDRQSLLDAADRRAKKDVTGYSAADHGMGRLIYDP